MYYVCHFVHDRMCDCVCSIVSNCMYVCVWKHRKRMKETNVITLEANVMDCKLQLNLSTCG